MVLQYTLAASRKVLTENEIYHPKFATDNREKFVLGYETRMVNEADTPKEFVLPQRDHWDRITTRNSIIPSEKIVVSNCKYFLQITPKSVPHFEAVTNQIAQTKKIVAYLCPPDTFFLRCLQLMLSQNRDVFTPSRTRIKERIGPLAQSWTGAISLTLFSEAVLTNGNIVDDFFAHHLPDFDTMKLVRPKNTGAPNLSAEALALLIDRLHGRLDQSIDPAMLVKQIILADARLQGATTPSLRPEAASTLRNWAAPDLAWLHNEYGIQFVEPGYRNVDFDDIDLSIIHFTDLAQLCPYDADRKHALYEKALARAKLPKIAQRLLTIW
jgi:hypothetical protein